MWLRSPPPAVPPEFVARLGDPDLVFGPNVRFRVASAACALVLVAVGVMLFLQGLGPGRAGVPLAGWVGGKVGVPLVLLGVVILIGGRLVPLNWVFVCPGGVVRTRGKTWDALGWAEVERFEDASLGGPKGISIRQCRLVLKGGGEWGFLADNVAGYGRLAAELRERVAGRDSPRPGPAAADGGGV